MRGPDQNVGFPNSNSSGDRPIELDICQDCWSRDLSDTTTIRAARKEYEAQPLLEADIEPPATTPASGHRLDPPYLHSVSTQSRRDKRHRCLNNMEKVKKSKISYYVNKVAVTSEPGLTNAQLMLTNFDLKPGPSSSSRCDHSQVQR